MTNKNKYIFLGILFLITFFLTANACNLQDFVVVDAPKAVLDIAEVEGKLTLAEADKVWEEWQFFVETNTKYFEQAVRDAENRYATLHSLFSLSLNFGTEATQGLPYGGIILSALTGVAGLMLPTPKVLQMKKTEKKG